MKQSSHPGHTARGPGSSLPCLCQDPGRHNQGTFYSCVEGALGVGEMIDEDSLGRGVAGVRTGRRKNSTDTFQG